MENETQFINYTPHELNMIDGETKEQLVSFTPSGLIIRADKITTVDRKITIDGHELEIRNVRFGEAILVKSREDTEGTPLPEQQEGVILLVSALAGAALKEAGRTDFLIMDDTKYDGRTILGATGFSDMTL
jgi:hypothetical protein